MFLHFLEMKAQGITILEGGKEGGRREGGEEEKEKEAAACLSILQSKPVPQRRSGGQGSITMTTPGPPKSGLQKVEKRPIE